VANTFSNSSVHSKSRLHGPKLKLKSHGIKVNKILPKNNVWWTKEICGGQKYMEGGQTMYKMDKLIYLWTK